jgi:hypothetical protein
MPCMQKAGCRRREYSSFLKRHRVFYSTLPSRLFRSRCRILPLFSSSVTPVIARLIKGQIKCLTMIIALINFLRLTALPYNTTYKTYINSLFTSLPVSLFDTVLFPTARMPITLSCLIEASAIALTRRKSTEPIITPCLRHNNFSILYGSCVQKPCDQYCAYLLPVHLLDPCHIPP